MTDCALTQFFWWFQGALTVLCFFGLTLGGVALSAHKRNRLLIRRISDEIQKSIKASGRDYEYVDDGDDERDH